MKKHIILTILSAAALLASCNGVEPNPEVSGDGFLLSLDSGAMITKSEGAGFENVIDHFDFFFFEDEDGTTPTPGMHGLAEGSSKVLDTSRNGEFKDLRLGTHYVYILANYPGEINHDNDYTLAQLLALPVESTLATKVKQTNPETLEEEETGAVTFCDYLVMDSYHFPEGSTTAKYTVELTPTKINEVRSVDISLSRVAAKLNLTLNIEPSVTGTIGDTWTPILQEIQAYYVNALNNKTNVGATPLNRAGLTDETGYDYFTYPTNYKIEATQEGGYTFVADPVYTYPQEWKSGDNGEPYFKVFLPWMSNKRGSSNFYYKITVPKPASGTTWTIDRNTCYNVVVDLAVVDAASDYVEVPGNYTIQDWGTGGEPGGNGLAAAKYFDVPVREYKLYSKESINIPFSSSSAVTAYFTEISYWYYGSTNGTHYHFRFNNAETPVSSVTLPTDKDSDNQSLNVQNYAGVSVNAAKDLNEYKLEVSGKNVVFSHNLNEIFSVRTIQLVIKNEDGRTANVTITQHPAIEVAARNSKNAFLDGWYNLGSKDVRDADGHLTGHKHTPTGNQYMPHIDYWRTGTEWTPTSGNSSNGSLYAGGNTSVRADHFFLTEVSVSAFSETNNKYKVRAGSNTGAITTKSYRLGDPRVPASTHYNSTTSSGTTPRFVLKRYLYSDKAKRTDNGDGTYTEYSDDADVTMAWQEPLKILIASQKEEDQNIIAPRLLVSSHMNITGGVPWNNSDGTGIVQRCAMYQEAGYPAGRWRLPTEAEFAFMMKLQSDGTLPGLFADNCYYRVADGRKIHVGTDGNDIPYTDSNSGTVYIRMVYDVWYWGDDPTEGVEKIRTPEMMTEWEKATDPETGLPNWKAHWADYYHPNMHER